MSSYRRILLVFAAVAGALAACVLCLPATGWLLITQYGSPTSGQYFVFVVSNVIIAAVGSLPGVVGLARYSGPKRPRGGDG
jgi:hypothetical protein